MCLPARKRTTLTHHDQKPEEYKVYVGTDETMTDVRERLAALPYESIILVVPHQTQLRHAIAWRVLARWSQEQGREIAIASSDKQIRALARTVHFTLIPATLSSEQRPRTVEPVEGEGQRKKRGRAS
jgi:hypothetical protein